MAAIATPTVNTASSTNSGKSLPGTIQFRILGHICVFQKNLADIASSLGNSPKEWPGESGQAFVEVIVKSAESIEACQKAHEKCTSLGAGTWREMPESVGLTRFPMHFPMAIIFNTQGKLRQDGDKVEIDYQGKRFDLTCEKMQQVASDLASKIDGGYHDYVDGAKEQAKKNTGRIVFS